MCRSPKIRRFPDWQHGNGAGVRVCNILRKVRAALSVLKGKDKAKAWTCPEGSRRLRLPD